MPSLLGVSNGVRNPVAHFICLSGVTVPQRELPLLARLDGPSTVHPDMVSHCKTYRESVRMCWQMRRVRNMTQRQLACEAGLRPQLVTDYLNQDDHPTRRDLPGQLIAAFESVVGNTCVSQWIAAQSRLTVLEEMQAVRSAA